MIATKSKKANKRKNERESNVLWETILLNNYETCIPKEQHSTSKLEKQM